MAGKPKKRRKPPSKVTGEKHMLNRAYGSRFRRLRTKVMERDGYRCMIRGPGCTGRATMVDHVQDVRVTGPMYDPNLLQAACRSCNTWKGSGQPKESERQATRGRPFITGMTGCPHVFPDGSMCPGRDGHWSRWNPREEAAAGIERGVERFGSGSMLAYRSVARAAGVSVDTVLRHAANDTLRSLVEGEAAERRMNAQHIERIERLTDLRIRDAALRALASD